MANQLHNELRKEFQLERLILFSDAVFAIAITLLVLEIKVPEAATKEELTDAHLLDVLSHRIPQFAGFIVSFMLIGQYWIVHHRMFSFVKNFTTRLIWLNLFYLFGVVLMPFSTAFYSDFATNGLMTPIIFYSCNICMIGFISFFMWRYISDPKHDLTENLTPLHAKYFSYRALTVPVLFIIFTIVYYFKPMVAFWIPVSTPFLLRILYHPMRKKLINPSTH